MRQGVHRLARLLHEFGHGIHVDHGLRHGVPPARHRGPRGDAVRVGNRVHGAHDGSSLLGHAQSTR